jgi:hypothetical protein
MNKSLILASIFALTLTACGQEEENNTSMPPAAESPAPAATPSPAPAPAPAPAPESAPGGAATPAAPSGTAPQ